MMKDFYEKLCIIIGQILCYSTKIAWASAPRFDKESDAVIISFKDMNNQIIDVKIPFASIIKVHDHTLETLVFGIVKDQGLL